MFSAKIIEDSVHCDYPESRLATFQVSYPRFIHGELMTHRVFSRNASSSRAIPFKKIIESIQNDPAVPVHWGKNMPGMQAKEEIEDKSQAYRIWLETRDVVIEQAKKLDYIGVHKQVINRLLEPWMFISVIITSNEFINWFALRNHIDAQPEIQKLAKMMMEAYMASAPKMLQVGQYHLPYVSAQERQDLAPDLSLKVSAARCCRVSYLLHDGAKPSVEKDLELFNKLAGAVPLHASPLEHQAMASPSLTTTLNGNFGKCWIQFRKTLANENITKWPDYLLGEKEKSSIK